MSMLDPKTAAAVAYRDARQIDGMIAELKSLYDAYYAPEEDRLTGGKYAIGRLIGLASSDLADDVLPKLREASVALVRYGDLLEVAALAIGDNPSWWEVSPAEDRFLSAKLEPDAFGILARNDRFGLAYKLDDLIDPGEMVEISAEQAEELRGLGVYFHNLDDDPSPAAGELEDGESPF